jgi:ribonuclease D
MPERPLPTPPKKLVSTPEELTSVCEHLRSAGTFAFDTEFIGENTYHPILCLIQVATAQRVDLIDPMALSRNAMQPFWQLLADESLEKICHAGDQDVEIVWQHSGLATRNMFDTQIGAGMLGISYPTALWRVVEHFAGITLEKAHTYSAWDRRPLTRDQFEYAIDDVRYLPAIHQTMKQQLAALNHAGWMQAACDEMCREAAKPVDARRLFTKIRGAGSLNPEQLSVLREITALREQISYEHDVPARAFLKDEALFDIASRLPQSSADLARIRDLSREELDSYGEAFLEAVRAGLNVAGRDRPNIFVPGEDPAEVKRLAETLWVAAQAICLGQCVTPGLVTSQSEIAAIARLVHKKKPFGMHPLMQGWHGECLGAKLSQFIAGGLCVELTFLQETLHADFTVQKPVSP